MDSEIIGRGNSWIAPTDVFTPEICNAETSSATGFANANELLLMITQDPKLADRVNLKIQSLKPYI